MRGREERGVWGKSDLDRVSHAVQMCLPHLYQRTYTGSITGTNKGDKPVQINDHFPVVYKTIQSHI
jgi:hypothetical protein